jgi:hypothetical protein
MDQFLKIQKSLTVAQITQCCEMATVVNWIQCCGMATVVNWTQCCEMATVAEMQHWINLWNGSIVREMGVKLGEWLWILDCHFMITTKSSSVHTNSPTNIYGAPNLMGIPHHNAGYGR